MNFKEWLYEGHKATAGRIGLYPPAYTQVSNYAWADIITWGADTVTYLPRPAFNTKVVPGIAAKTMHPDVVKFTYYLPKLLN